MTFDLTREQSLVIILKGLSDNDSWDYAVNKLIDNETGVSPTIYDVLKPLGFEKAEIDKIEQTPQIHMEDSLS